MARILTKLGIYEDENDKLRVRFISNDNLNSIYTSSPGDISIIYNKSEEQSDEEWNAETWSDVVVGTTERIFSDIYVTGINENGETKVRHIAGGYGFNSIELKNWFENNKEALEQILNNIQSGNDIPIIKNFNMSFSTSLGTFRNKSEKDTIYLRIPLKGINQAENESNIKISINNMYFHYYFPNYKVNGQLFLINENENENTYFKIGDNIITGDNSRFPEYTPNTNTVYGEKEFIKNELEPKLKNNIWKDRFNKYETDAQNSYDIYTLNTNDLRNNKLEKRFVFVIRYSRNNDTNYEYQIIYGPKVIFEYPILTYSCPAEEFESVQLESLMNTKVNYSNYNTMKVFINSKRYNETSNNDFAKPEAHYIYVPENKNVSIIHIDSNMNANFVKIENQSIGINSDISDTIVYYTIYKSPVQYFGKVGWEVKNIK